MLAYPYPCRPLLSFRPFTAVYGRQSFFFPFPCVRVSILVPSFWSLHKFRSPTLLKALTCKPASQPDPISHSCTTVRPPNPLPIYVCVNVLIVWTGHSETLLVSLLLLLLLLVHNTELLTILISPFLILLLYPTTTPSTDYVSTFPSNNKHNQPTIVSILSGLASGNNINNNNNFFTYHNNNNNTIFICVRV